GGAAGHERGKRASQNRAGLAHEGSAEDCGNLKGGTCSGLAAWITFLFPPGSCKTWPNGKLQLRYESEPPLIKSWRRLSPTRLCRGGDRVSTTRSCRAISIAPGSCWFITPPREPKWGSPIFSFRQNNPPNF